MQHLAGCPLRKHNKPAARSREGSATMVRMMIPLRLISRTSIQHVEPTPFSRRFLSGFNGRSNTWLPGTLQNHVQVPKSSKFFHGFRTFCSNADLSNKKCVPCNSKDMRPMTEQAANELITKVSGWDLVKEDDGKLKLRQTWKVKSFTKGLEFFQVISGVAEAEGHHPDLHLVGWNNVIIEIWTHAVGGLTENDFILASKIDKLDLALLLRRKISG